MSIHFGMKFSQLKPKKFSTTIYCSLFLFQTKEHVPNQTATTRSVQKWDNLKVENATIKIFVHTVIVKQLDNKL